MQFTIVALLAVATSVLAQSPECANAPFPHEHVWGNWFLCCDYIGVNDVSTSRFPSRISSTVMSSIIAFKTLTVVHIRSPTTAATARA